MLKSCLHWQRHLPLSDTQSSSTLHSSQVPSTELGSAMLPIHRVNSLCLKMDPYRLRMEGIARLTGAVSQIALRGLCQVVNIEATWASLHLDLCGPPTAVVAPVCAGRAVYNAFSARGMRTIEPHGCSRVASQDRHTGLSHANATLACEPVPAVQTRITGVAGTKLCAAPVLSQGLICIAGVLARQLSTRALGQAIQPWLTGSRGALTVPTIPCKALGTHARVVAFCVDTGGQGMTVTEPLLCALIHINAAQPRSQTKAILTGALVRAQGVHAAAVGAVVSPWSSTFIHILTHQPITSEAHLAGARCDYPIHHAGGVVVTFRTPSCGQKSPTSESQQFADARGIDFLGSQDLLHC